MHLSPALIVIPLLALAPAASAFQTVSGVELQATLGAAQVKSGLAVTYSIDLDNTSSNLVDNVNVQFEFLDAGGASALAHFDVVAAEHTGISAVDGSQNLGPMSEASVEFEVTPKASAAVAGAATDYRLVVTVIGTIEGSLWERPVPVQFIQVLPAPILEVELYWPSEVHGDWSSTLTQTEVTEPFVVGAVIRNVGSAPAIGVDLVASGLHFGADPLGAAVHGAVTGLELDGLATTAGFSIPASTFGELAPGQERRLLWTAISNHEAQVTGFDMSFVQAGALVHPASLVTEQLVHSLDAFEVIAGPLDDGRVDWLVDSLGSPAPIDPLTGFEYPVFPSAIVLSDGTTTDLTNDIGVLIGAPPSAVNLTSTATTSVAGPGWHYLRFDDPGGAFFGLAQVTRTLKALHLPGLDVGGPGDVSRVWTTTHAVDNPVDGLPDFVRREIHIVDFIPSAGTWEYGLGFVESSASALTSDVEVVSASLGGQQNLTLNAGPAHAGEVYLLLGSISGTVPGVPVDNIVVPLNFDAYMLETIYNQALQIQFGSLGFLDVNGQGSAQIIVPAGFNVGTGIAGHHAFILFPPSGGITFASNAVPIFLLP